MKIIVVGCGKVGRAIIESMVDEKHDVVAIDNNSKVIQNVANTYDVMAVYGNATNRELLVEAGVAQADLFLAVTATDEVNMLACFLAKKLGARQTVARIRESNYNDDGLQFITKQLELSMALNPERMTAESLFNFLKLPSAVNVDTFAGKRIQILEFIVRENSKLINSTLSDLRRKCPVNFIVCAVKRDEETFIPNGAFCLSEGDKVAFMVKSSDNYKFLKSLGMVQTKAHDIIIIGGSSIAYYLAKKLSANNYDVKIIERDKERVAEIAEILPSKVTVIHGDGMSQDLLWEEGIKSTDAFVALTGEDEENILISFYAMSQDVPKVVSKVNRAELASLAEKLGLDCIVSPQKIVADVLTRYARALSNSQESKVETLYRLMDGDVEAVEFVALSDSSLVGVPLKDLKLKEGIIIAGIIREKESVIPTGVDAISVGDRVIVVSKALHLCDLSDVLR